VLVLAILTAAALVASIGVALRAGCAGRAELFVVTSLSLWALLAAPVLVLGYANVLTATSLALAGLTTFAGAFALSARGRGGWRKHLRACGEAALALSSLPVEGVRLAWEERSIVVAGVVYAGGLFALALLLAALVPFASWDGLFYHEPIVGFAIQNHGFSMVELPRNFNVQAINGYPRLCEAVAIWPVIFSGRALIEIPSTAAAAPLVVSVYVLCRRYSDRVAAMGWSVVVLLVPHIWHLMCSTYIDLEVGFFLVAAMHYASRPQVRVRDALVATLAMVLVVGSKGSWPLLVPPIAVVAYGRLVASCARARPLATASTIAGGGVAMGALAAVTLVRNWSSFGDPFWPITMTWPAFHVTWPGLTTLDYIHNPPIAEYANTIYENPHGGWDDIAHRGIGLAIPWVILPVSAAGFAGAALAAAREIASRGKRRWTAVGLWLAAAPGLIALRLTPSLEEVRYNIHLVAAVCLGCAYALRGARWNAFREGVLGASIVLSLMPFHWVRDAFQAPLPEITEHLAHPFASHVVSDHPLLDLLGRQREEEIHAGDRVVFTDDLAFVGTAWNSAMSNRVDYVPYAGRDAFAAHLKQMSPQWVIVGGASAALADLTQSGRWEVVGTVSSGFDTVALRRKDR
jgi:hypothetical protein